jgi:flavin-binding protein dodecin
VRDVRSAWVKQQLARIQDGNVVEFQVNLHITFVLE